MTAPSDNDDCFHRQKGVVVVRGDSVRPTADKGTLLDGPPRRQPTVLLEFPLKFSLLTGALLPVVGVYLCVAYSYAFQRDLVFRKIDTMSCQVVMAILK